MIARNKRKTEILAEKARLLDRLRKGRFNVPDFICVPADHFIDEDFAKLDTFLQNHQESYKVIVRSAHPLEEYYRGGTFDSLETYGDVGGIKYARNRMIRFARTTKQLSILRQQHFNHAPDINPQEMGVIIMPFIEGTSVMGKMIGNSWEFGYSRDRTHKVQREPYITNTPHDLRLLELSQEIQKYLGFRCEIEFIVSSDGEIFVVQAKDISNIEILEQKESDRSIHLDGIRRIRKRRNYRERPIYVMDTRSFYIDLISKCEDMVHPCEGPRPTIDDIVGIIKEYEEDMKAFALRHQRFGILGLSIQNSDDLYQVANHYLDEMPELQAKLSKALHNNLYQIDIFLSEADTLIAKNKVRVNLCSHDAYGIDTVRIPIWNVYWRVERHKEIVGEFKQLGFKTGETVGIDIDSKDKPTIYRL